MHALLDAGLAEAKAEGIALEAHLQTCATCRSEWNALLKADRALWEGRSIQPRNQILPSFRERVAQQPLPSHNTPWASAAALSLCAALMLVTLLLLPFHRAVPWSAKRPKQTRTAMELQQIAPTIETKRLAGLLSQQALSHHRATTAVPFANGRHARRNSTSVQMATKEAPLRSPLYARTPKVATAIAMRAASAPNPLAHDGALLPKKTQLPKRLNTSGQPTEPLEERRSLIIGTVSTDVQEENIAMAAPSNRGQADAAPNGVLSAASPDIASATQGKGADWLTAQAPVRLHVVDPHRGFSSTLEMLPLANGCPPSIVFEENALSSAQEVLR